MKCFIFILVLLIGTLYAEDPLKLPENVKPEHYKLRILTLLEELQFEGTVDITVKCEEETKTVVLHVAEMTIVDDKISIKDLQTAEEQIITDVKLAEKGDFLRICLQNSLVTDHKYNVHIEFQAQLQDIPRGYYLNGYIDEQSNLRIILNTHFEPIWARTAFPCFDLPHMKATFEVTIGRPAGFFSLNNMPLAKSEPIEGKEGWFWDQFQTTMPMSTYLLAFAVLDGGMKKSSCGKITFWYPPTSVLQFPDLCERSKKILEFLERYFEMDYDLPKLDFLLVRNYPPFASAVESWGLVIFQEQALSDLAMGAEMTAMVTAHELTHQWIGNTITMKCFGQVWLKEGITSYITSLASNNIFDGQTFDTDTASTIMSIMSDYSSEELSLDNCPEDLEGILTLYSPNTYFKGGLITRMIEMSLGLKDLKKTTNLLLMKHKFHNFDEKDLWSGLKETTIPDNFPSRLHMDVVWTSWTRQGGFPLVEVTRNYKTGTATLTQRKFNTVDSKDEEAYCWWIPIPYKTKSDPSTNNTVPKEWMNCPKESLVLNNLKSSDWILVNLQSAGLFIVKYDDENFNLLSETLRNKQSFEKIPHWDRFKLILDSFFLIDAGLLSHESLLTALLYLQHETHYMVWMAALKYLDRINWLEQEVVELKNEYMRRLIKPHFSKQLFTSKESSTTKKKFQKEMIHQACHAGDEDCIKENLRLFEEFKKSFPNESTLDEIIFEEVFCNALQFDPLSLEFLKPYLDASDDIGVMKIKLSKMFSICQFVIPNEEEEKPFIARMPQNNPSLKKKMFEQLYPALKKQPIFAEVILNSFIDNEYHEPSDLNFFKNKIDELGISGSRISNKLLKKIENNMEWGRKHSKEIETALKKILRSKKSTTEVPPTTAFPIEPAFKAPRNSKFQRCDHMSFPICVSIFVFICYRYCSKVFIR